MAALCQQADLAAETETAATLGQAARDPSLLGSSIRWWPKQLGLLDTLDDPTVQLHVWALGRQAGKTSIAAAFSIHNAAMRPDLDQILPAGRIRYVLVAGAGQSQAREFIRVVVGMLEQISSLDGLWVAKAEQIEFTLPGGRVTRIRAVPTWGRTIRGISASAVILDEFAHVAQTAGPGADEQVYAALTPTLRAFGTLARTLVISTPAGRTGKFFDLFTQAADGMLDNAVAVQGTVTEIVESVDPDWLEQQRQELGDALYAQEYEASFNDSGGAFFDLSQISFEQTAAFVEECDGWIGALDPAFHADSFGYALIGRSRAEPGRWLLGPVGAIKPEGEARSFDARRGREDDTLAQVLEHVAPYRPTRLFADQHQASAIQSYFGHRGIHVETVNVTGTVQSEAFIQLRARLQDASLRAWEQPQLIDELRRVRAKDGTKIVLTHRGDSHCDTVMALALAVHAAELGGGLAQVLVGPSVSHTPGLAGGRGRGVPAAQHGRYGGSEFS